VNAIQETLSELRRGTGIKGCAVVTTDGLVVAHALDALQRDDVVSGLASFLLMTTARSLEEGRMGPVSQFTLHATNGKVVFVEVPSAWLVVIFDQFADLEACKSEIQSAVQTLRRQTRLGS
jgi:predicted regulator of Ras-like GTPase activity (Roadblock/LC7/MglB family)